MALLQVATTLGGITEYHPMAVSLDMIASVSYATPLDLFRPGDALTVADNDYSVVTFKKPLCVSTEVVDGIVKHILAESVLVTGHFQEVAIALGLDTNGEIQEQVDTKNN